MFEEYEEYEEEEEQKWIQIQVEKPPEGRIIHCADCKSPMDTVVFRDGVCLLLNLEDDVVVETKKVYFMWKFRD